MKIKTASSNQIKGRKKLLISKYRKKENLFLAEGLRCVEQILENDIINVLELFVEEGFSVDLSEDYNVPLFSVSPKDFNSLSDTDNPQGVIAVCEIPEETPLNRMASNNGFIVALDAIQDPGNLGTMIRTASWFGASGLIFGNGTADPFHPKVVRSTAGATGTIPYLKGDLSFIFSTLEESGFSVLLLDGSSRSIDLHNIQAPDKFILVAGNEGNGINPDLFTSYRKAVRIDGDNSRVESLNAAVALSIGLYHLTSG